MGIKDAIALRVQNLCNEHNITICKLATNSGLSRSTIYSMLEPERRDVSAVLVKKICDGFGISIIDFYNSPEFYDLEQEIK